MTNNDWPEHPTKNRFKGKPFNPSERYDIVGERYFIPNHIIDLSLTELLDYPYFDTSCGSLLNVCSSDDYWDTHSHRQNCKR